MKEIIENPKVKVGDLILLKKSKNGASKYEGPAKVTYVSSDFKSFNCVSLKPEFKNCSFTVYDDATKDVFCLLDREAQAKWLEELNVELEEQMKSNIKEMIRLRSYKDDESETAAKLKKILECPTEEAIAEVLRTLKRTDYL